MRFALGPILDGDLDSRGGDSPVVLLQFVWGGVAGWSLLPTDRYPETVPMPVGEWLASLTGTPQ